MAESPTPPAASERPRPVVLVILDGFGWREERADNAVAQARKPVFDQLWETFPHTFLRTDGLAVGLPEGQFGNSEVGHTNLGAGRVVMQELPRIDAALRDGSLAASAPMATFLARARAGSGRVHLWGLLSPGGVHAHMEHALGLARILAAAGLRSTVHAVLDGRDTPPRSAAGFLGEFAGRLRDVPGAAVESICGRYFAMDRDHRWERTEAAYAALVDARAPVAGNLGAAVEAAYAEGTGDEFVPPVVGHGYVGMADGDSLLCFNFRADRVRQTLDALLDPGFGGFPRARRPEFAAAAGMTSYSADLDRRLVTLFSPEPLVDLMGEVVSRAGLKQLRMAETEKYPHVTFFFNGGEERPLPGEERILVPSPKVATYDLAPEMSAAELAKRFVDRIATDPPDFVLINFANPDMVGHTGSLPAAIRAVEAVDTCLGDVVAAVRKNGGCLIVTADHGNCETMRDPVTGQPHTAHTLNPVPCILVDGPPGRKLRRGRLADVAPTLLELMAIPKPAAMTGESLIEKVP